ncbi:MAG: TSUP family transporter [Collimonas sp.]
MIADVMGMGQWLPLLLMIAFATYFQTVTGFGLGMIVVGAASGLNLAPVSSIAAVVSLLSLTNCIFALPGAIHHVDWRATRAAVYGLLPAMACGVLLLNLLDQSYSPILKLLLGLAIIYGAVSIVLQRGPGEHMASRRSFFVSGIFGGLFAGMFALAGPPLVYQFYRQPMNLKTIRYSLIFLFAVSAAGRSLMVGSQGHLSVQVWLLCLLSLPVGALATVIGKRYPPPMGQKGMQRVAFFVLIGIGVSLLVPALLALFRA